MKKIKNLPKEKAMKKLILIFMLSTMIIGCSSKSSSTAQVSAAESNALSALADLKGSSGGASSNSANGKNH